MEQQCLHFSIVYNSTCGHFANVMYSSITYFGADEHYHFETFLSFRVHTQKRLSKVQACKRSKLQSLKLGLRLRLSRIDRCIRGYKVRYNRIDWQLFKQ